MLGSWLLGNINVDATNAASSFRFLFVKKSYSVIRDRLDIKYT